MDVTAFVFDGVMSLDVLAPLEAATSAGAVSVRFVSQAGETCWGFDPLHSFAVDAGLDDLRPTDLLLVPGGLGSVAMMRDAQVTEWLQVMADKSTYVMAVSTGSLLLAAAGLLDERDASGHWLAHEDLARAGAHPTDEAVTWQGNIVTTAGSLAAAAVARTLPDRVMFGRAQ
jgi:transcriptional regulator GlxA family with amidase domain